MVSGPPCLIHNDLNKAYCRVSSQYSEVIPIFLLFGQIPTFVLL